MNNTAQALNGCLNGRIGVLNFLRIILRIFKSNIKDLVLITMLLQVPILILAFVKLPASMSFIVAGVSVATTVVTMVSIVNLIDARANGKDIIWLDAIISIKNNWFIPSCVIVFQSLIVAMGTVSFKSVGLLLGIILNIILVVSVPLATLGDRTIMGSFLDSFDLVKSSLIDVTVKLITISLILGLVTNIITIMASKGLIFTIIGILLSALTSSVSIIVSMVFYYNLPMVEKKKA